ncbi:Microtubule-associated protein 9 [Galemys pyrenaicus]|uniref:Microtubule-associated protein 9 n=1 Tax=Galemys pyrenaicus TaxID=202257 RepID=A0A8J5ZUZ2_GALPY|nr:Microtubule-associated protein 9 [Galemys pyrenaicus]
MTVSPETRGTTSLPPSGQLPQRRLEPKSCVGYPGDQEMNSEHETSMFGWKLILIISFQDELIKAITARSARQRSSEYSDDFDSDEIVSLGDFSDTSADENSVKKKINDFYISDEERNSPKLSFLKTKKSNSDIIKNGLLLSKNEEMVPENYEDMGSNPPSEPQNKNQEIEQEIPEMKPKPRILSIKSTSSAENSSLEVENHLRPSPRPRSLLKKHSQREEKDGLEDKETALPEECKEHDELVARPAPLPPPRLNGRQPEAKRKTCSENLDPEVSTAAELLMVVWNPGLYQIMEGGFGEGDGDDYKLQLGSAEVKCHGEQPSCCATPEGNRRHLAAALPSPVCSTEGPQLTNLSSSSLKESPEDSFTPESGEKASIQDQNEELAETQNSLKSNENEENSSLLDDVTIALEKSNESQVTFDDLEEEKETKVNVNDDLTVDVPLLKSQRILISNSANESTKLSYFILLLLGLFRLMTSEFLKKPSSIRRISSATTSSHYLGTLKVLDQKPSRKQSIEPDKADSIRAAVYQKRAAKREEALASFEAWKAMKGKEAKKIAAKKRLEEKNKKKTEEENAARKGEAVQVLQLCWSFLTAAFEKWKEKKMEYLKEKNKKEREFERAKKQKEEETVAEKRKDNLTAVEKWNEKKEAFFKEKEKEKINEKRKEELKRAEKKDKDKQAIDEYEKWLEKKERKERIERKQKKRNSFLENEALPPWNPPSRTVFSRVF